MKNSGKFRSLSIFFVFLCAYIGVLYTVYLIAIVQKEFFLGLAQQQYTCVTKILPERGMIVDRCGRPLAYNKEGFAAFITPSALRNPSQLEPFLELHFPASIARWKKSLKSHFCYIARHLSDEQIALIKAAQLDDLYLIAEPQRYYPMPALAAIVGLTDVDNKGVLGVELLCDHLLGGEEITVRLERDARSGFFYFNKSKENEINKRVGKKVQLTIDADLQYLVREAVAAYSASYHANAAAALVIDPPSGDILAAVSIPDFDPNAPFSEVNPVATRMIPFVDAYELGSVMKTFVALALLEEGLVAEDEVINCQGCKIGYVNGVKISTWKAHGHLSFDDIIRYSNNLGIATLALRLGPKLYDHYQRLGFGSKPTFEWPGQQIGFVNEPRNWSKHSIISLSFGYEIRSTLLQLAQAFSVIALDGVYCPLNIIKTDAVVADRQLYNAQVVRRLKDILEKTVKEGTAHRAQLDGYRVMGKTGTANLVIDGRYSVDHNVYTFAGIIEKDGYQRLIVTFVKDIQRGDLYASRVAVPLFEHIAQTVLIHDKAVKLYEI